MSMRAPRGRGPSWLVPVAMVSLALAACGDEGEAGFGAPNQEYGQVAGERSEVTGTVAIRSNGCLDLELAGGDSRWLVWPAGIDQDQGQPVLDGSPVQVGDKLSGTAVLADASALPDWSQDGSYFASFGGFCDAAEYGVVAFDDVARVS